MLTTCVVGNRDWHALSEGTVPASMAMPLLTMGPRAELSQIHSLIHKKGNITSSQAAVKARRAVTRARTPALIPAGTVTTFTTEKW